MDTLLQVRSLGKAYNAPVLVDFDWELQRGEIHALMGSNGAGKSTLARILSGLTPYDRGELLLDGRSYRPASKGEASAAGVVMVMQELNIIPTLSVAENLLFHRLPSRLGLIDQKALRQQALRALQIVSLDGLDLDASAGALGVGHQQMLEIASALIQDCRLLILDEPTAALTGPEIETLFCRMNALAEQGVAILYISHRMEEIRRVAQRVTIMRDGRRIGTYPSEGISNQELIRHMAGKDVWSRPPMRRERSSAPIALEARRFTAPPLVSDLSFQVRTGEIVGLAGLVGSGRTEALQALFGAAPSAGELRIHGQTVRFRDPSDAVAAGIGMVPEDRKTQGLLLEHSLRSNATLASLTQHARWSCVDRRSEEDATAAGCKRLEIKRDRLDQAVSELSGGNQQKVVILRWLLRQSSILLLDEPTRGIDVAAKESIYALLRELASEGCALLIVSSELLELMALCDRILVLSGGRIVQTFTPDNWSQEAITEAAFSAYLSGSPAS